MQPEICLGQTSNTQISQLIIVGTSNIPQTVSESIRIEHQTFIQDFIASEKDTDFLKDGNGILFFTKENADLEKMRMAGFKLRKQLDKTITSVEIHGGEKMALAVAEGLTLSNYQFLKYLSSKEEKAYKLAKIALFSDVNQQQIDQVNNTNKAVYWSRDLVNEPHSYLTATQLSNEIVEKLTPLGLHVNVLEKHQIEALKLGGLIAVNLGSEEPPTFSIIEYKPEEAQNKKPVVLVGKGIVYDTGGLSLKPTAHSMDLMKSDMGGAACMVGTMMSIALNKLPVHVICIIPATDNRPGKNAYAPGDIITMYNGKTVEIKNTDAEGRMVLADALAYGDKYDPELVIDAATLTGAAVRAIGTKASVVMGNANQAILDQIVKSGQEVHERLVQLPFWDEYGEEMKSDIADLNNLGGPYAGMITAGKFLENFTNKPYIHLDIAGPAFLETEDGYRGKGGSGVGVRLLTNFLGTYTNGK
jgi:leucyl aminopeptidase